MKRIGGTFEYYTASGERRIAKCVAIEFHQLLGKPIFIGVTPFGYEVRLTANEIRFIKGGRSK